nr:hypothetical protein CFP56_75790 [Quercus suber]
MADPTVGMVTLESGYGRYDPRIRHYCLRKLLEDTRLHACWNEWTAKIAVSMKYEIPCLDESDGLRYNEIVVRCVSVRQDFAIVEDRSILAGNKRVVRIHWSVARRGKADFYEVVIQSEYRSSRPLDLEQLLLRSLPCTSSAGKTEHDERYRGRFAGDVFRRTVPLHIELGPHLPVGKCGPCSVGSPHRPESIMFQSSQVVGGLLEQMTIA